MKHTHFDKFTTGLARDGPPLPEVDGGSHAIKILIVPVLLGYFDLGSDLYTAVSYYKSSHPMWFGLGLFFALGPAVIVSAVFLPRSKWYRRVLVATQLSLLFEALVTVVDEEYSDILALVRVIEPLFESVPQLLLQLYALLFLWVDTSSSPSRLVWRVVSVCISATSLAFAATDVCSVERFLHKGEGVGVARSKVFPCCPSLTGLVFSRLPVQGSSPLNGVGNVHPRRHVWLCFVYHVLEIVSRFVSMSMLALVMRKWFFLVLPYLWGSRCLIVLMAALNAGDDVGYDTARKALKDFRFRVRLVAMPFLDSVLDGMVAYTAGLLVTLVEFTACLAIYRFYRHDDLPSRVGLVLYVVAIGCMVGKMCLALVAIYPLQDVGGRGAVVADESVAGSGATATKDAGVALATSSASGDTKVEDAVVTDESVVGSGATATKEAKVEREGAPLEGGQLQPSTLATSTASGEVKVEDGLESV